MALPLLLSLYYCLSFEGAYLFGYFIKVMEDAVIGVFRDAVDIADGFWRPRGEDEEGAVLASMETGGFGFPIARDWLFLDYWCPVNNVRYVRSA